MISKAAAEKLKRAGKMVSTAAAAKKPPRRYASPEALLRARSGGQINEAEYARLRAMMRGPGSALTHKGPRQSTRGLTTEQKRARTQHQIRTRQRGMKR